MKRLLMKIKSLWYTWKAAQMYDEYKEQADKLHVRDRRRVWVVPTGTWDLVLVDRKGFRIAKSKGWTPVNASMLDIKRGSIYYTPDAGENDAIGEDEQIIRRSCFIKARVKHKLQY